MSATMQPIKGDFPQCDTTPRAAPFIITGPVLRVTPRVNGFMVEMKGLFERVNTIEYKGKQAPEWLVSGAIIEVDFEKNSITLLKNAERGQANKTHA